MKVLDLFSGIGGFSLGLERAGMETVAFCEIEEYPRKVLRKHWPKVPIYDDVRELTADRLFADGIREVDVICGGFPCQDISLAGKGAGIEGDRSGLWSEIARLISELRPRYAIMENVSALLSRGLDKVLGDLAEIGYDAEWHCIPASAVGAPHQRDRVWIVADTNSARLSKRDEHGGAGSSRTGVFERGQLERAYSTQGKKQWEAEPSVGRVANGVPRRVDRLRCLGNAVVPQIPEIIGRALMEAKS